MQPLGRNERKWSAIRSGWRNPKMKAEMDPIKEWWVEEIAKRTIEKLQAHEFKALYVKTKEEATKEVWKYITPDTRVGAGGSVTIRELGILDQLKARGNIV